MTYKQKSRTFQESKKNQGFPGRGNPVVYLWLVRAWVRISFAAIFADIHILETKV